jgi:rod shape-determining protein MreC
MFRKKSFLFLAVLLVIFALMTYQGKKGSFLSGNPVSALLYRAASAITSVSDSITRPFHMMALRDEENRDLKKRLDELNIERMRYQEYIAENRRLKDLLKLKGEKKNVLAAARIIGRGTNYWANTLVMDKGASEGIVKDAAAITPRGLAGKVTNVSDSYSSLLLITDINFSAAVRLQESRKEGVLAGTGTGRTVLKYIPPETEVREGDIVITSGLDLLFPPGIPAGYISKVDKAGSGQFQYIEVAPFTDSSSIEEVLIIKQ